MKAIVIDAEKAEVRVEDIDDKLETLQSKVGGLIELGFRFSNKDILYVDEEGLYKNYNFGFVIEGRRFVGNGIVTGLKNGYQVDVISNDEQIKNKVEFFTVLDPNLN